MAYITVEDIAERSARITELVPDGYVQEDWLAALIEDAEAIIDARLANRYAVPMDDPPDVVKTAAFLLVMHRALRENYSQENVEESEWVRSYYDDAMALLDGVVQEGGELLLPTSNTVDTDRQITFTTSTGDGETTTTGTWDYVW